jgi:tetratricopeptide (TPR) repeat protein
MLRRLLVLALILALAGVAGFARAALDRLAEKEPADEELLYLPNGKHLKIMSLGHANLVADLLYLWAIQYYSDYEREQRHRYVEHVFAEVITELDPHYVDAYWLGALILIVESGEIDAGIALLEKGARRNPDKWILPYLIGWECYHARRYECATSYFERASRIPDAPTVVRRMRAGMIARQGDVSQALASWREILQDPQSDALSMKIARRKVRELQTRFDVETLQRAAARFRNDNGRWPLRLEELVARSYIRELPRDPDGRAYLYDARTGEVFSPAGRLLGGS